MSTRELKFDKTPVTFSDIPILLKERDLNQGQLAQLCRVSDGHISRYLAGNLPEVSGHAMNLVIGARLGILVQHSPYGAGPSAAEIVDAV